jgi:shikimate kinase/3-dehydroquinate synthase
VRNVVLIGFMGTGKSEVGRRLARRLGWAFVDTDRAVEAREGAPVARIFARRGEGYFRDVEAAVVARVAERREVVVATGGGVVLRAENMARLRRTGWVVALTAPPDVLARRLGDGRGRPLLGGGDIRNAVGRLLDQRRPLYRDADLVVDVSSVSPDQVVTTILEFVQRRERQTVPVRLGERSYPVHVGEGIACLLGYDLQQLGVGPQVVVVTHQHLLRTPAGRVLRVLRAGGYRVTVLAVPPGERAKSLREAGRLYTQLARARVARDATVVALGGGVVGDLAGFVAATYMRGLRLVQVPTTLLAMVDSSIGGKTAVNHAGVKNLVGVVHQPALVVCDVRLVATLPDRELRSGLAEVVKTAVVGDPDLFAFLETHLPRVMERDPAALVEVVRRCAAVKARVVEADERDAGPRHVLNYGHTLAHAIEAAAGWGRLTHGEAVAIGMTLEAALACRLGLADAGLQERQRALLARCGLPTDLPPLRRDRLLEALRLDKKVRRGVLWCALPVGIGAVRSEQEVPEAVVREVLVGAGSGGVRPQPQPAR